jgi:hypothetical protein
MTIGLVHERAEPFGIGGVEAVEHALDGAADHLQRRAELVGDVGEQLAAAFVVRCEAVGHLVERWRRAEPSWRDP